MKPFCCQWKLKTVFSTSGYTYLDRPKKPKSIPITLKLFGSATTCIEGKVAAIDETFGDLCDAGKCYGVPYKLFESELDKNRGFTFSLMIQSVK